MVSVKCRAFDTTITCALQGQTLFMFYRRGRGGAGPSPGVIFSQNVTVSIEAREHFDELVPSYAWVFGAELSSNTPKPGDFGEIRGRVRDVPFSLNSYLDFKCLHNSTGVDVTFYTVFRLLCCV